MKTHCLLACAVAAVAGCASPITKQDQQSLAQPINCATSTGDLRMLAAAAWIERCLEANLPTA